MRQILVILLTLVFALASFAQPNPDTLWTRTYGGSARDVAWSVQQTADGGYIVAGGTVSFGAGDYDFYLVKTNSLGDPLWTRTYGGSSSDNAYSVQQTADGGYIVAGNTYSFGAGTPNLPNMYLVKTNSQGDTLWTRTYGGISYDAACSVQRTTDGGYMVAGRTYSFGAGSADFYLVKTNSQGDTLWTRTYGRSSADVAYSVQQTADGGYIVAGSTWYSDPSYADFYVVKTGPDGLAIPSEMVILLQSGNAVLMWPPTGAPSYNIYGATEPFISGTFLDSVTDTTWTDDEILSRPSPYFYYVTAVSP